MLYILVVRLLTFVCLKDLRHRSNLRQINTKNSAKKNLFHLVLIIFFAPENFLKKILLVQIFFYPSIEFRFSLAGAPALHSLRLRFFSCQVHTRYNEASRYNLV